MISANNLRWGTILVWTLGKAFAVEANMSWTRLTVRYYHRFVSLFGELPEIIRMDRMMIVILAIV